MVIIVTLDHIHFQIFGYIFFLLFEAPFISITKAYVTKGLNTEDIKSIGLTSKGKKSTQEELDMNGNVSKQKVN